MRAAWMQTYLDRIQIKANGSLPVISTIIPVNTGYDARVPPDRNIRVSFLMPGATRTEVGDNITDPNWRAAIQAHVAKDGAVLPEEIAATLVFMLAMPRHVNISEICVRPTIDTTA